jgi:hypothetical protein
MNASTTVIFAQLRPRTSQTGYRTQYRFAARWLRRTYRSMRAAGIPPAQARMLIIEVLSVAAYTTTHDQEGRRVA